MNPSGIAGVTITDSNLVVTVGTTLSVGQTFTILIKVSAGAITGTFAGIPQGGTVAGSDGTVFSVSYIGGDGNDIVLTVRFRRQLQFSFHPVSQGHRRWPLPGLIFRDRMVRHQNSMVDCKGNFSLLGMIPGASRHVARKNTWLSLHRSPRRPGSPRATFSSQKAHRSIRPRHRCLHAVCDDPSAASHPTTTGLRSTMLAHLAST